MATYMPPNEDANGALCSHCVSSEDAEGQILLTTPVGYEITELGGI